MSRRHTRDRRCCRSCQNVCYGEIPVPYVLVSANKPASQARPSGPWRRHGPPGCAHLSSGVLASRGWRGTVFPPRRRVRKPEQRPRGHQRSRLPAHPEAGSRAFPPAPRPPWPGRRFDRVPPRSGCVSRAPQVPGEPGSERLARGPQSGGLKTPPAARIGAGVGPAGPPGSRQQQRADASIVNARMGPREPEDIPGNSATLAPPRAPSAPGRPGTAAVAPQARPRRAGSDATRHSQAPYPRCPHRATEAARRRAQRAQRCGAMSAAGGCRVALW